MSTLVRSLPADWYHNEQIFTEEQQKIFKRHWSFVSSLDDLQNPGQFIVSDIAGQSVVVCRNSDNDLRGYLNLCRHRASPLCTDQSGRIARFICPYHAWSYDLNGSLLLAPGFDESLEKDKYGLIPVRVDCWNNLVFVCLSDNCPGLREWLGDIATIAEKYPAIKEMEFEVMLSNQLAANWKNYSDNSAEGYHLATIHPRLNQSLTAGQTRISTHENGQFVNFEVTSVEDSSPGNWLYKFPALLMHFSLHSFNLEKIMPLNATRSALQRWFWFNPGVSKKNRRETIAFSSHVMEEDMGICSRVQKNLEAGHHDTGMLSPLREPGTIYIQACVRKALA